MEIRRRLSIVIYAAWLCSPFVTATAHASNICEREMQVAATRYQVPIGILYAVGLTETGRRNSLQPYALNIDGRAVFYSTAGAALAGYERATAAGAKFIDVGCMQINAYYHSSEFASIGAMLAPARNVDYAARFLKKLRQREGSWTMAVARYNAGPNNDPAQKIYVCRVIANMVASGFGRWTDQARTFCG